ncbi:galectin-8-like [Amblyraja radiata]|uniref:galectin-8-like n=1 Tax=Amblyraja radiata TaxID=386614 RepID=UPI0014021714|nr:galectin-8-like [Amblyraja radiata]
MMKQLPIYNPIIPFIGRISGRLQDGKVVIIQGQVPEKAVRFEVDFVCSNSKHSDIAFHFNMRYDQSTVVCNTLENANWGTEEIKHQVPVKARSYFELIIKTCNDHFQVSVDGQHFLEYRHRLPMMRVDTLGVSGDVHVNAITFKEPDVGITLYTCRAQAHCGRAETESTPVPVTVSNPVVPYKAYIGAIRPQQLIKIVGTVNTNATKFSINLMANCWDNIALHIGQRFNEKVVVRNSRIQQEWGTEERALPFHPFVPGQTFELGKDIQSVVTVSLRLGSPLLGPPVFSVNSPLCSRFLLLSATQSAERLNIKFKLNFTFIAPIKVQIMVQSSCYAVSVNGRHLFNYNHRLEPLNQINQLEVIDDVSLSLVQY